MVAAVGPVAASVRSALGCAHRRDASQATEEVADCGAVASNVPVQPAVASAAPAPASELAPASEPAPAAPSAPAVPAAAPPAPVQETQAQKAGGGKKNKRGKKGGKNGKAIESSTKGATPKTVPVSAGTAAAAGVKSSPAAAPPSSTAKPARTLQEVLPPFSLDEALRLQGELQVAFAEASFQKQRRRVEAKYPHRLEKGHAEVSKYTADMQALIVKAYDAVLPRKPWCLSPGWLGARQMTARMTSVADHPKVMRLRADINDLLGMPRNAAAGASLPAEEPVVIMASDGSGGVPTYPLPLVTDSDGDLAHEFWVEDLETDGMLRCAAPRVGLCRSSVPGVAAAAAAAAAAA